MDDLEELRRASKEWVDADRAVHNLLGLGKTLEPGRAPEATMLTVETLSALDAAEARQRAAYDAYREAMRRLSEHR